jgi:K+-sensing histidine kinase KdpD
MKTQEEKQKYLETAKVTIQKLTSEALPTRIQAGLEQAMVYLETAMAIADKDPKQDQHRLEALYQVSQTLGSSLKLDEVLEQVMDSVIDLTKAERGFLILTTNPQAELIVRISRNFDGDALAGAEMNVSRSVIREALGSGKGVVTTNAQEDPRFHNQESVIAYGLRSIMCAPLQTGGKLLGVIYVDSRAQMGTFEAEDLDLLQAFASQAAAAIANAQQFDQTDRFLTARLRELEGLSRFVRILNTQSSLSEMLETTQKMALDHTDASNVWVAVNAVDQTGVPVLRVVVGEHAGQELVQNHPVLSEALRGSTPHIFEPKDSEPARIIIPLIGEGAAFGLLIAEAREEFSNEDVQFLTRLINHAASAFAKAQLFQEGDGQPALPAAAPAESTDSQEDIAKFVSIVSHELRIPMTSIMGYADLLKQGMMGELNENQLNFISVIRENVDRMNRLTTDLSDIYKTKSGRLHLDKMPVLLSNTIQGAQKKHKDLLEEKYQQVELDVPQGLPLITNDAARIEQVIGYLIENASMYSAKGAHIQVRASAEGDGIRVEVQDPGIGIAPEDQVMLFTEFFRSEMPEVRELKGWGLGLAVVKNLVEYMGGMVGFESTLGEGSTFWFTIPGTPPE